MLLLVLMQIGGRLEGFAAGRADFVSDAGMDLSDVPLQSGQVSELLAALIALGLDALLGMFFGVMAV